MPKLAETKVTAASTGKATKAEGFVLDELCALDLQAAEHPERNFLHAASLGSARGAGVAGGFQ